MWNVVICDDEADICTQIQQELDRFAFEQHEEFQVAVFSDAERLIREYPPNTDILLLDISMPRLSGLEAARRLREQNCPVTIIFITTMAQYAIDGYAVHAFGFLKKPLQYQQLCWVLTDALRSLRTERGEQLVISANGQTDVLSSRQVLFFDAIGHSVKAHLPNRKPVACTTPLSSLEQSIGRHGYFRCHKSYLVNLLHIHHIGQATLVMDDGSEVPISKHRRREFMVAFAKYCGGKAL